MSTLSLTHGTTQDENADFSVVECIIDSLTGYYLIILRVCGTVEPFRLSYQTHPADYAVLLHFTSDYTLYNLLCDK